MKNNIIIILTLQIITGLSIILALSCKKIEYTIPVLHTENVTFISLTSAHCTYSISSDGGKPISARGVCWSSTNTNPTISDSKTNDNTIVSHRPSAPIFNKL